MCGRPHTEADPSQAQPNMVKSTVVDNDTGKSIDSTVRTSTGTFFGREVRPYSFLSVAAARSPSCRASEQCIDSMSSRWLKSSLAEQGKYRAYLKDAPCVTSLPGVPGSGELMARL